MLETRFDFSWENIQKDSLESQMQQSFIAYIKAQRWFGSKNRSINNIRISEIIKLNLSNEIFYLLFVELFYSETKSETYLLPVSFSSELQKGSIAKVNFSNNTGYLNEAVFNEQFQMGLLHLIRHNKVITSSNGDLTASKGQKFEKILQNKAYPAHSRIVGSEQSNTSFFYDDVFFLKLYRRLQKGLNPDAELTKFLTEAAEFTKIPAFAGSIEWLDKNEEQMTICLLQEFVKNKGDAWGYFKECANTFLKKAIGQSRFVQTEDLLEPGFIENINLLAERTAQMHIAFSQSSNDENLMAEPVTDEYREFLYSTVISLYSKVFEQLNFENSYQLIKDDVAKLISIREKIYDRIEEIKKINFTGQLIRIHGDYHLGQVLFTGNDFIISDFEGEPVRNIGLRRQKHIALKDAAGMLRSFYYTAFSPILLNNFEDESENETALYWAQVFYEYLSEKFLISYLNNLEKCEFMPKTPDEIAFLLNFFMLEKAIYEFDYELNNRPQWILIPAKGIWHIMNNKIEVVQS